MKRFRLLCASARALASVIFACLRSPCERLSLSTLGCRTETLTLWMWARAVRWGGWSGAIGGMDCRLPHPHVLVERDKLVGMQEALRKHKLVQKEMKDTMQLKESELQMALHEAQTLKEAASNHARQAMLHLDQASRSEESARANGEAARQSGEAAKQSAEAATVLELRVRELERLLDEERRAHEQQMVGVLEDRRRLEDSLSAKGHAHEETRREASAAVGSWSERALGLRTSASGSRSGCPGCWTSGGGAWKRVWRVLHDASSRLKQTRVRTRSDLKSMRGARA